MKKWTSRIKLKELFTEDEDAAAVRASMAAVADRVETHPEFVMFRDVAKFRAIPDGDDLVRPVDYANKLLDRLYDYADDHAIWIE